MIWNKLWTQLSPNNSQISTDLLSSSSGTESAKNYTNYRKKNLQSCLHIFSANLKLPRMRYRKNAWNKIWGHPQFDREESSKISVLLFIKFHGPQINNRATSGSLEIKRVLKTHLILVSCHTHVRIKYLNTLLSKKEMQYQVIKSHSFQRKWAGREDKVLQELFKRKQKDHVVLIWNHNRTIFTKSYSLQMSSNRIS